MIYKASYDRTVKVISTLVTIPMLLTAVYCSYQIINSPESFDTPSGKVMVLTNIIIILNMVAIPLICYIYSPQYYELNEGTLVIKRVAPDRPIQLNEISEIRLLDAIESRGIIRTFGVGGLFGYFGKFSVSKLGTMDWYATQNKNRIIIFLKTGKKIVFTPDDLGLVEQVRSKISS